MNPAEREREDEEDQDWETERERDKDFKATNDYNTGFWGADDNILNMNKSCIHPKKLFLALNAATKTDTISF